MKMDESGQNGMKWMELNEMGLIWVKVLENG